MKLTTTRRAVLSAITIQLLTFCIAHHATGATPQSPVPLGRVVHLETNGGTTKMMILDTLTGLSTPVLTLAAQNMASPSWSPDGQWLAFSAGPSFVSEVYRIRPDGTGLRQLTFGGNDYVDPDFSPCGADIAFQPVYGYTRTVSFNGGPVTTYPVKLSFVHWFPDGKKLLGSNWGTVTYESDLFVYDLTTGTTTQITHHEPGEGFNRADWSPDGQKIIASRINYGSNHQYDLILMNADGTGAVNLTPATDNSSESGPAWSPDNWILYTSDVTGNWDIWAMRPDGSGRVNLTRSPENEFGPPEFYPSAQSACNPIYTQDFSTNPGWTTDDPAQITWDSASGTLHGIQYNTQGTYAYVDLPGFNPNASWRLEWDQIVNYDDWSAGLTFGLWDPRLVYPFAAGMDMGIGDGGLITTLIHYGSADGDANPPWASGVWYHNTLQYDSSTHQLTLTIAYRSSGNVLLSETQIVASFPTNMTRLGASRLHMKNTGGGASPYAKVDYNLDNIRLCGPGVAPKLFSSTGHYYEYVPANGRISWTNALLEAASRTYIGMPGHLATVTSAGENSFLLSLGIPGDGAWLGGIQLPTDTATANANWQWITGEPWNYHNWGSGEPNDNAGWDEFLLAINGTNAPLGYWNDAPGMNGGAPMTLEGYFVEYEPAVSTNHPPVIHISISPLAQFPGVTNLVVISRNGVDAKVLLDASASSDADGDDLIFSWTKENEVLGADALITATLAIGTHQITVTVSDGTAITAETATVEVITLPESILLIMQMVHDADLGKARSQALLASLRAAFSSFEQGKHGPGVNQLEAFQKKVQVQIAPENPALAADLIDAAQVIIDASR